ncbi:MAG: hypothetical protein LAP40_08630 [Acidobacteriia bacterium]|nr:hypothetical protein [Terriglobia bacterium]
MTKPLLGLAHRLHQDEATGRLVGIEKGEQMKTGMMIGLLSALVAGGLCAQDIVGDWHGTIKTPATDLRIALHITKGDNGGLKATMDSVDQGANGLVASSVKIENGKLTFDVDVVNGSYEGTVSKDGSSIAGAWSQGQAMPLEFQRGAFPAQAPPKPGKPSDIDGTWLGTLDVGGMKLRLVFHIVNTEAGLTATSDSPDQNVKGIPVSSVTRDGSSLKLEMKGLAAGFEGKISADLMTIDGTFSQGPNSLPLVLKRTKEAAGLELRRPRNPVKPDPSREDEVA